MSSVLLWGEMGARSSGGSLNFGFQSHLCTSHFSKSATPFSQILTLVDKEVRTNALVTLKATNGEVTPQHKPG